MSESASWSCALRVVMAQPRSSKQAYTESPRGQTEHDFVQTNNLFPLSPDPRWQPHPHHLGEGKQIGYGVVFHPIQADLTRARAKVILIDVLFKANSTYRQVKFTYYHETLQISRWNSCPVSRQVGGVAKIFRISEILVILVISGISEPWSPSVFVACPPPCTISIKSVIVVGVFATAFQIKVYLTTISCVTIDALEEAVLVFRFTCQGGSSSHMNVSHDVAQANTLGDVLFGHVPSCAQDQWKKTVLKYCRVSFNVNSLKCK
ncbi:hypothetical protein BDK51DRAFT_39047 [Blyttiomyces helicus]|uniref:Uncharacterized protein n=1 Tax=Blyttiomyces helicus TaxID=388810 RepID=A0A4P9WFS9_9FUNG|nr:hypothetical protein BDK51DRAFT_39047 [Blyttiomyces helicus]|eukprot:RKO91641.1 hypothetical protein BDK51DRAFT_39047 [Blyttiomyces helicus]